jgi:hypothetical protein
LEDHAGRQRCGHREDVADDRSLSQVLHEHLTNAAAQNTR